LKQTHFQSDLCHFPTSLLASWAKSKECPLICSDCFHGNINHFHSNSHATPEFSQTLPWWNSIFTYSSVNQSLLLTHQHWKDLDKRYCWVICFLGLMGTLKYGLRFSSPCGSLDSLIKGQFGRVRGGRRGRD
jgi:hypothetical protein